ncbi:MAG: methyl-accepting chemotaxis protein [Arhodomonas sp.]|nr:methyl-accepting chemotaxis protein [Arhodomonas sp.]
MESGRGLGSPGPTDHIGIGGDQRDGHVGGSRSRVTPRSPPGGPAVRGARAHVARTRCSGPSSSMDSIREQIQETSKRIKRLGESSQEIGNIVELINDIADQTNILALNASIQAAMAGESGRGFAVVADEVQRLAERSGNATKQIEALVQTIQTDTNEAVISMEQSTAGVVAGARQAEEAGEALREIEGVSEQLAGLIQSISEASRQQAHAAANVSDTMNVIQEITSQTSTGTTETASSIGNLAELASDLRASVAGFKLPEGEPGR